MYTLGMHVKPSRHAIFADKLHGFVCDIHVAWEFDYEHAVPMPLVHDVNTHVHSGQSGEYGECDEWRSQYTASRTHPMRVKAKPILTRDDASGRVQVESAARYQHCARITGQYVDANLLHGLPLSNLHQQCRDDEMHMFRSGLMLHILSGVCARYIRALHTETGNGAGLGTGTWAGVEGMKRVFRRLGARVRGGEAQVQGSRGELVSQYVASSFERAFSTFSHEARGRGAYQWGLTGAEAEQLYFVVPFCLTRLVEAADTLAGGTKANAGARADGGRGYSDPGADIVRVMTRFATWYMAIKTAQLTDYQVQHAHACWISQHACTAYATCIWKHAALYVSRPYYSTCMPAHACWMCSQHACNAC